MIKGIRIINFRNFSEKIITFEEQANFIVGENGKGKTSILEAISILSNNSLLKLNFIDLINTSKDYFFIEIKNTNDEIYSIYFSSLGKKKSFSINNKKVSSKKFFENTPKSVLFSPLSMNMLYLSPSLRRDFIDDAIMSCFFEYGKILKDYKIILKSRNSLLKAINTGKARKEEMEFWNEKFINTSVEIYNYRRPFIEFLSASIIKTKNYFSSLTKEIEFKYITKIDWDNISETMNKYLKDNFERDIILQKTHIGPHIDDFEINIQGKNIANYASRGEVKSTIIYLKLLEAVYLEKRFNKKPILIIDDLVSELDDKHKNDLLEKIKYYQSFLSVIIEEKNNFSIKI